MNHRPDPATFHPTVSVVIPTFNRNQDVVRAIRSIAGEDIPYEVIVVDDGSTDSTPDRIRELGDPRVRCVANYRKKGVAGARNTGLLESSAHFVAFLDDDDLFLPGHLTAACRLLEAEPEVGLVFGTARYLQGDTEVPYMRPHFDRKIHLLPEPRYGPGTIVYQANAFLRLLVLGSFFNVSTVVIRRSVITPETLFNEELFGVEDFDMWIRIARDHLLACLTDEQAVYRLHADNMSFGGDIERRRRTQANGVTLWRNILSYPWLPLEARRIAISTLALELADLGYFERQHGDRKTARRHLWESIRLRIAPTTLKSLIAAYVRSKPASIARQEQG